MMERDRQDSGGITAGDMVRFFLGAWKSMLLGGLLAGLVVGAYIAMLPHKYGATATVRMAEIPQATPAGSYVKANVEAPALLSEKLRTPSLYPAEVTAACRVQQAGAEGEALVERLSLSPRNPENVVSFTVRGESAAAASECASAMFELIRRSQAAEAQETLGKLSRTLEDLRVRMAESRAALATLEKPGASQVAYLVQRDEVSYLGRRMDEIRDALDMQADARLVAPIHSPSVPLFPRRPGLLLGMAVVGGMLAGFLVSAVRRAL